MRRILYKCRRCGEMDDSSGINCSDVAMILRLTDPRQVPLTSIHFCKDGGMGVSDLIGASAKEEA